MNDILVALITGGLALIGSAIGVFSGIKTSQKVTGLRQKRELHLPGFLIRQGDILFRDWNLRQEYREHLGAHVI